MLKDYVFTSESVTEGHPDKMADGISDAVLDAMLAQDPKSRVACETMITTGLVVLAGEITTNAQVDFQEIVRNKIKDIGYDHSDKGFDCNTCSVMVALDKQSPDIAQGVNEGEGTHTEQGAGDQGLMFGYAVNESESLMPLTTDLSHKLAYRLTEVRKSGIMGELRADGKTQVSAEYVDGKIKRLQNIVISTQHSENLTLSQIQEGIREEVINKVVDPSLIDNDTKIWINPTGKFVIGGPMGDCGLTGRKIIVDTYDGHNTHGNSAFSGKDPSKVDKSAAYATKQVAKHIITTELTDKTLVQIAYTINITEPMSFLINTFDTKKTNIAKINKTINEVFDIKPKTLIKRLDLLRPIYNPTSAYGHFGRDAQNGFFPWEELNKLEELKSHF